MVSVEESSCGGDLGYTSSERNAPGSAAGSARKSARAAYSTAGPPPHIRRTLARPTRPYGPRGARNRVGRGTADASSALHPRIRARRAGRVGYAVRNRDPRTCLAPRARTRRCGATAQHDERNRHESEDGPPLHPRPRPRCVAHVLRARARPDRAAPHGAKGRLVGKRVHRQRRNAISKSNSLGTAAAQSPTSTAGATRTWPSRWTTWTRRAPCMRRWAACAS